jgi:hypothetical protein
MMWTLSKQMALLKTWGGPFLVFGIIEFTGITGCSVFATRPIQQMSDCSVAIRAAKEVQADVLAPELYRQAMEMFFRARKDYKFKNFLLAREYAEKAKKLAEQAEFEAIRSGGNRIDAGIVDPMANGVQAAKEELPSSGSQPQPAATPYPYPTPEGIPADSYDQRMQEQQQRNAPAAVTGTAPTGAGTH